MKNVLFSVLALILLAGCGAYYDYYKSGVRYTQDGKDCIYYAGEYGRRYSDDIKSLDSEKKIVYRNTRCIDLYTTDNEGQAQRQDRKIVVPAARPAQKQAKPSCGCKKKCDTGCGQAIVTRRYVIVPVA